MPRRHLYGLAGIVAAAALARFATLDLQSFDHDEAITASRVLHANLFDTLATLPDSERTPPLYYVLAWAWSKLFGTGEIGLRSLSALFGTLTVPVAYLAGARLASRRAGLIAAALVALSPLLVWYSQQARAYALLALLSALTLLLMARALDQPRPRWLALWALAGALALATHYFAAFVLAPQLAWMLMRIPWRQVLSAAAGVTAAGFAILPLAIAQTTGNPGHPGLGSLPRRAAISAVQLVIGENPTPIGTGEHFSGSVEYVWLALAPLAFLLVLVAAALLVARGSDSERRGALIAGSAGLAAVAVPIAVAFVGADFFTGPNAIGALPTLAVALAAGLGARQAGRLGYTATGAICALFAAALLMVNVDHRLQRHDWRAIAETLGPPTASRVILSPATSDDPLRLYLGLVPLPTAGKPVEEIDLVGFAPPPAELDPPAPGFALESIALVEGLELRRYRSSHPRPIRPDRFDAALKTSGPDDLATYAYVLSDPGPDTGRR